MAGPITWQNIPYTRGSGSSHERYAPQDPLTASFDIFNKVLTQREAGNAANVLQVQTNNKNAFMDQMASYRTPEELAAAQGTLEAARAGLDTRSAAELRGAFDARLATVRTQQGAEQKYSDDQLDRSQLADRDQVAQLQAQGKFAEADAILARIDFRNEAPLHEAGSKARNEQTQRERATTTFEQGQETHGLTIRGRRIEVANQELADKDAKNLRSLEGEVFTAASGHIEERKAQGTALGGLASKLGLPVDALGMPKVDTFTEAQMATLNAAAKAAGLPSTEEFTTGDTARGNAYYDGLVRSGKHDPRLLAQAKESILGQFNTANLNKPRGNDAALIDQAAAKNKVAYDEMDASNWYAPNTPDAIKAYDGIASEIEKLVPDEGNRSSVQAAIYDLATTGIKMADGTTVMPSANDIRATIRSSRDSYGPDWAFGTGEHHGQRVIRLLTERMNTPEVQKRIQEGLASQQYRRTQKVKDILKDAGKPPEKEKK